MVRNITDVDDPLFERAEQLGVLYTDLANEQIESFHTVMTKLNFKPLFSEPRVSEYIDQISVAVAELVDNSYGYYIGKDIYFDVSKYKDFKNFSGYSKKLLLGLFELRGGDLKLEGKRNKLDFLLWKNAEQSDPASWQTKLGRGRPGWHIECSVMSSSLLGTPFRYTRWRK